MPPTLEAAPIVEEVFFPSGDYPLHGELAYPEAGPVRGVVVIAGPHPLLGGTMHNNVVRGLGDGLALRQFVTLRFNYRGVGRSEGPRFDLTLHLAEFWRTSHVAHELDLAEDVTAAVTQVREIVGPIPPLILIGYSFGCALLPLVRPTTSGFPLVLVAPTVAKHDYEPYQSLNNPILVIASEDDFASDGDRLQRWFGHLTPPSRLLQKRLDNHFFRGHEPWLVETVVDFLEQLWR